MKRSFRRLRLPALLAIPAFGMCTLPGMAAPALSTTPEGHPLPPAMTATQSATPAPAFTYDPAAREAGGVMVFDGAAPSRVVTREGRSGLTFRSIRGRAMLPRHTADKPRGTATLWVLPLQELFPATQLPAHSRSNPFFNRFVFLSDREAVQEVEAANFTLLYETRWYPAFLAKFGQGTINQSKFPADHTASALAGFLAMPALVWQQLAVTWDHEAGVYQLFSDGVMIGHSDVTVSHPPHDAPAPALYFGSPAIVTGEIAFYDQVLSPAQLRALFDSGLKQAPASAPASLATRTEMEKIYEGRDLPRLDWRPGGENATPVGWARQLALPLRDYADYAHFFHQGGGPTVRFGPDGLRVTTPGLDEFVRREAKTATGDVLDMTRMYLWTRRVFEGDLYLSVHFQIHSHGGLALLMTQASGMQGEDFLADYPLRSTGSMSVVHMEDVRNYHWEFYREMTDTRNDLVSHAVIKNPWLRPVAFQIENRQWETGRWYRLEYLQQGARLRGAIDGVTVFDATDTGFDNNGPVLRHGHVALRAMMRTDMTFRDLEIWTKSDFEK
ncbi:hypothetical protein OPIT5_30365 [Opitutaceae bacterium TAV5]|nr:hypothetical protein OPIT5_30365 [Opitutaceae bacterium TAV5]